MNVHLFLYCVFSAHACICLAGFGNSIAFVVLQLYLASCFSLVSICMDKEIPISVFMLLPRNLCFTG
ncbi:hypothetical protein XENTR_v10001194 [Xenopus tropicalis]|nr:hypothetical protein XENTR_v10001194 [Xenopus tropicalis]